MRNLLPTIPRLTKFLFWVPAMTRSISSRSSKDIVFDEVVVRYPEKVVKANFTISSGTHLTIVGNNGAGKSTLIKLITGEVKPNEGTVHSLSSARIGYLPQDLSQTATVSPEMPLLHYLVSCNKNFHPLATKILEDYHNHNSASYKSTLREFNTLGGFHLGKLMSGLELNHIAWNRELGSLSGGERTRATFVQILFSNPDILLLDEPTNHLDLRAITWLQNYLQKFHGTIVLVTHDRHLLQIITRSIVEIDATTSTATFFRGTYFDFLEEKRKQAERQLQAFYLQQKKERELREKVSTHQVTLTTKRPPRRDNNKAGYNARGERYQNGVTGLIRRHQLDLQKIEENRIEKPKPSHVYQWSFAQEESEVLLPCHITFNHLSFSFNHISPPLLENLSGDIRFGTKVTITGRNGSGKSTLLRLLLGELTPQHGKINFSGTPRIGYLPQEQSTLNLSLTPIEILRKKFNLSSSRAEEILLTHCLFNHGTAHTYIKNLSIGQQRRLQLTMVILQNPNILMLDEPTNHLDIMSAETLENQLLQYPGTVISVSHDRYFIEKISDEILQIEHQQLVSKILNTNRPTITPLAVS